jgi:hypothetical protein
MRSRVACCVQEIRGISLVFREMWGTTGLNVPAFRTTKRESLNEGHGFSRAVNAQMHYSALAAEVTSVRLDVEQNQLVSVAMQVGVGDSLLQGA